MYPDPYHEYFRLIDQAGIFDNSRQSMFPQTVCAKVIRRHFERAGKAPKALIIGFDGTRADSMCFLVKGANETVSGVRFHSEYSAVNMLKTEGGLYLSYAGGEPDAPQETSTPQGWASILTGEWGSVNGVLQHAPLSTACPTVLRELAQQGKTTAFLAEWDDHFTITYREEMAVVQRKGLPFVFQQFKDDEALEKSMLSNIQKGTDCIFGIFEAPDHNGHSFGFGKQEYRYVTAVCNLDRIAFRFLQEVESRPTYHEEDWLFLITSDHGGHGNMHGTQLDEDRTTFIACNKKLPEYLL